VAAFGTLVSLHSRRAYKNAIDKFIAWYCSEPRLGFNEADSAPVAENGAPSPKTRTWGTDVGD
jgi:hypothetical protein